MPMSTPVAASVPYPAEREADVALRDGSTVHIRPVRASDETSISAFLQNVSADSIGFRFFGAADLKWVTSWSLDVDYADRFGLIAETGTPARIISHACYVRVDEHKAEVAFLVADAWQGRGISTIMLAHLAAVADQHGISTFHADVLPANHRMIEVFRQSGFPIDRRSTWDTIEIELPTSMSQDAIERFDERERIAAVAAVSHFLTPHSIAVVGASRRRGTIGGEILHNLISGGFTGPVYPVNPHAGGCRASRHIAASDRSPTRWIWPSWPCRAPRSPMWPASARPPESAGSWSSRPGLPRPARREGPGSEICSRCAAPRACGWSDPTAWAC